MNGLLAQNNNSIFSACHCTTTMKAFKIVRGSHINELTSERYWILSANICTDVPAGQDLDKLHHRWNVVVGEEGQEKVRIRTKGGKSMGYKGIRVGIRHASPTRHIFSSLIDHLKNNHSKQNPQKPKKNFLGKKSSAAQHKHQKLSSYSPGWGKSEFITFFNEAELFSSKVKTLPLSLEQMKSCAAPRTDRRLELP